MTPIKFYENKQYSATVRLQSLRRKIIVNSIFRLAFFLASVICLFSLVKFSVMASVITSVSCFSVFLYLVRKHILLQKSRKYWQVYLIEIENEIKASNGDYSVFNAGGEYIDHRHPYSYDIDTFGKGGLFQMLNRTATEIGSKLLAKKITTEMLQQQEIISIQNAIKELCHNPELLIHFRATGKTSEIVDEDINLLKSWVKNESLIGKSKILHIISLLSPSIMALFVVLSFFNSGFSGFIVIMFLFNFFLIGFNFRKINTEHNSVSRFHKTLQKFQLLINVISNNNFKSEYLLKNIEGIYSKQKNAGLILKSLTKMLGAFDSRLNFLAAIVLEGFLLWDFHCIRAIEKWRVQHADDLPIWLDEIANFDALVSLANYAFNNPGYVYPEPDKSIILKSEDLGHPLIPASERICNDFELSSHGKFKIITGANMAGKSTFLRTVAVNQVLAMAGVPVCARYFKFKPVKLFTSMRTSDSLSEHESYFYAELRRLKEMFLLLESNNDVFIILDEILKGTNSLDKQKGSRYALEKILKLNGTGLIATHDLELTKIVEKHPEMIENQCFEIEIDNAKISFDYKLYNGVTKKMNAMLLMEQMGII